MILQNKGIYVSTHGRWLPSTVLLAAAWCLPEQRRAAGPLTQSEEGSEGRACLNLLRGQWEVCYPTHSTLSTCTTVTPPPVSSIRPSTATGVLYLQLLFLWLLLLYFLWVSSFFSPKCLFFFLFLLVLFFIFPSLR